MTWMILNDMDGNIRGVQKFNPTRELIRANPDDLGTFLFFKKLIGSVLFRV